MELARPNEDGISEWVDVNQFTGEYVTLRLGNGACWCRKGSALANKYVVEKQRSDVTSGRPTCKIRLNGFNTAQAFNQNIRQDIRDFYAGKPCVMLGICGKSINTSVELDHKDGRKNDPNVSDTLTQKNEHFQPLCKAANDAKRQFCLDCIATGKRWNAQNIEGNPYAYYAGDERYTEDLRCVGCYQYDPVAYRAYVIEMAKKDK